MTNNASNTSIEKKAYFGQRGLKRITIPEHIRVIGDWAFASCRNLEEVEFLGQDVSLGKAVFQKCEKLRSIRVRGLHPDVAYLLGAVPVKLNDPYLLDLREAGNERWLAQFDAILLARLQEHEMEGFAGQFVCGEEDSGRKDEELYREERRMEKAELAYLRLLHPYGLNAHTEEKLRVFLQRHQKGCVSEAAWKVVLDVHGSDLNYAALYLEIAKESFHLDGHLKDIGEDYPELKAFLLRDGRKEGPKNFFEALDLK